MKKTQLYTLVILSFCSAQLNFMMTDNFVQIFPRDRIFHTGIAVLLAFIMLCFLSKYRMKSILSNIAVMLIISARAVFTGIDFINYFHAFHGSNTIAIVLFSLVTAVLFWKYIYYRTHLLYSFFIMFNISLLVFIVIFSADKINVANIYSNSTVFDFNMKKLPVLFDIITVCVIAVNKQDKMFVGNRFLIISGIYMVFITLLQGLCIKGNMLYRVSPLHALVQTLYTGTIARFDYIFTIYYTLNYLAAVMLYSWALKITVSRIKGGSNESF